MSEMALEKQLRIKSSSIPPYAVVSSNLNTAGLPLNNLPWILFQLIPNPLQLPLQLYLSWSIKSLVFMHKILNNFLFHETTSLNHGSCSDILGQDSAHCGLAPVFVNLFLLGSSCARSLHYCQGCFDTTTAEQGSCNRDCTVSKSKIICPFTDKFADPCSRTQWK